MVKPEFYFHHPHRAPGDAEGVGHQPPVVTQQRQMGSVHGNRCAAPRGSPAHRNADIGLRERGRVIHTVTNHDHGMARAPGSRAR